MKTIYIHAGHYKTGTTAVQRLLANHRARLADGGVFYPDMPENFSKLFGGVQHGPMLLFRTPGGVERRRAYWRGVTSAFASGPYHSMVVSGEALSGATREEWRLLLECFGGFETHIVLCLRHWNGFMRSRYQSNILCGDSQIFPGYLKNLDPTSPVTSTATSPLFFAGREI